jgi:hypothetical protein
VVSHAKVVNAVASTSKVVAPHDFTSESQNFTYTWYFHSRKHVPSETLWTDRPSYSTKYIYLDLPKEA